MKYYKFTIEGKESYAYFKTDEEAVDHVCLHCGAECVGFEACAMRDVFLGQAKNKNVKEYKCSKATIVTMKPKFAINDEVFISDNNKIHAGTIKDILFRRAAKILKTEAKIMYYFDNPAIERAFEGSYGVFEEAKIFNTEEEARK